MPSTTMATLALPYSSSGDGTGFADGCGFYADLERMHKIGMADEILSWRHSCNHRMGERAEEKGRFIALDDFYGAYVAKCRD